MLYSGADQQSRLLIALAEDIKASLASIARALEIPNLSTIQRRDLSVRADMLLKVLDVYVLGLQPEEQTQLRLEPVGAAAIAEDAAAELSVFESMLNSKIQVHSSGNYGPVLAERALLQRIVSMLGYSMMAVEGEDTESLVTLGIHKSRSGIVIGAYSRESALSTDLFMRARALTGSAKQLLPTQLHNNGATIFVADSVAKTFASPVKVARHGGQSGLAVTLLPSNQLQLV